MQHFHGQISEGQDRVTVIANKGEKMSETPEGYTPDTDLMILAYAAYRDNRDMGDYKYDMKAGQDEWIRIRNKATEEAYRWLESVKQEVRDENP